jgi:hypothetical protein
MDTALPLLDYPNRNVPPTLGRQLQWSETTKKRPEEPSMSKDRILEVVEALPDDVDVDSLIEKLYVLRRLELAEQELAAGHVIEHDEVEKRFASWLE